MKREVTLFTLKDYNTITCERRLMLLIPLFAEGLTVLGRVLSLKEDPN